MAAILSQPISRTSSSFKPPHHLRTVISFPGAINRGNTLLYLPRQIRNHIYALALTPDPQYTNIEVPDTADLSLPSICEVDHIFRHEVTALVLKHAVFTVPSDAAVYNFFVFLDECNNEIGCKLLDKLEIVGLELFEKDVFASNGRKLLQRCRSITELQLMIDLRDLPFISRDGHQYLDLDTLVRKYELWSLVEVPRLKKLRLCLTPFMALAKRVKDMEQEQMSCVSLGENHSVGIQGFWGLKRWVQLHTSGKVQVQCPSIQDVLGN